MPGSEALRGRAAVITGGSLGIGRAVARALADEGAAVLVNGRGAAAVEETVSLIAAAGGQASGFVGSAADFAVAGDLIETCAARFGSVDVLVNCAGIAEPPGSSILDLSPDAWRELIDVHLTAVFNTCRHAAPRMVARGSGSIVNTSSHAYIGWYGGTGYPAGKGGTNSLTFAMAADLREHGVRVNAVCPGARTRLSSGPQYEAHIEQLHRRGLLDDGTRDASLNPPPAETAAPLYVFLASDGSRSVTGRLFSVAGGYVGVHDAPGETMVAFRNEADGAWPVDELGETILRELDLVKR